MADEGLFKWKTTAVRRLSEGLGYDGGPCERKRERTLIDTHTTNPLVSSNVSLLLHAYFEACGRGMWTI